jgi:hemerythrin
MELLTWTDRYHLGISDLDYQHRKLFKLINKLHFSAVSQREKEHLIRELSELVDNFLTHFADEELEMQSCQYPHYNEHKSTHDRFVQDISRMEEEYGEGRIDSISDILSFVVQWLTSHISSDDSAFAPHLTGVSNRCLNR